MKTLVLYAHPGQRHSKINTEMSKAARAVEGVTFIDLYQKYPRHEIDIDHEQKQLLDHDAVVFQFPVLWYSSPSLVKEWFDLVLEYGFAYGEGGDSLRGKIWLNALTAGAPETAYGPEGHNKLPLADFFAPLKATAQLCHMTYLPPYAIFSAHRSADDPKVKAHIDGYSALLSALCEDRFDVQSSQNQDLMQAKDIAELISGESR